MKYCRFIFFAFLITETLAFRQNWTRKEEVDHYDLFRQHFFFFFFFTFFFLFLIILKRKVILMLHTKYQPNIPYHSGEKVDFNWFRYF